MTIYFVVVKQYIRLKFEKTAIAKSYRTLYSGLRSSITLMGIGIKGDPQPMSGGVQFVK